MKLRPNDDDDVSRGPPPAAKPLFTGGDEGAAACGMVVGVRAANTRTAIADGAAGHHVRRYPVFVGSRLAVDPDGPVTTPSFNVAVVTADVSSTASWILRRRIGLCSPTFRNFYDTVLYTYSCLWLTCLFFCENNFTNHSVL